MIPKAHKVSASHRLQELKMMEMCKWLRDMQEQWLAASELHKLGNGNDRGKAKNKRQNAR